MKKMTLSRCYANGAPEGGTVYCTVVERENTGAVRLIPNALLQCFATGLVIAQQCNHELEFDWNVSALTSR